MSRNVTRVGGLALVAALGLAGEVQATLLGPSPYLSFAESPFNGGTFSSYFHLETFEDALLNTPGVSAIGGAPLSPPDLPGLVDSVDVDDGAIDGSGVAGHSFYNPDGPAGISFVFDELVLGGLPTSVGLVWTDGINDIVFEAFDRFGASLGVLMGTHADSTFAGTTAEDRFYGVTNAGGISRLFIRNPISGLEVDHLQYGLDGEPGAEVTEPATMALVGLGLGLLAFVGLRQRFYRGH